MRSFLSFDINNKIVLENIRHIQDLINRVKADLKIVKPENIHITIRFLGNIDSVMVEKIFEQMNEIKFSSFNVRINGVGAFPNLKRPRVIWIGITEGNEKFKDIFNQLENGLQRLGFNPEKRGFKPHLTIARVKSGINKIELARIISENEKYDFGTFTLGALKLKKSELTPRGPIYSILKEVLPQN